MCHYDDYRRRRSVVYLGNSWDGTQINKPRFELPKYTALLIMQNYLVILYFYTRQSFYILHNL